MFSLSNYKTPAIIENEVILHRQDHHKGSFLLLEGDDDSKFWGTYTKNKSEIVICGGKSNLVGAVERLDNVKLPGILGLPDDDFDSIDGTRKISNNLIYTNAHDLECILLQSNALNKILSEYGDTNKISDFERYHNMDIRQALVDRGLIFGQLRWLAKQQNIKDGLEFKRFKPTKFMNEEKWEVKREELYSEFITQYNLKYHLNLMMNDLHVEIAKLSNINPWKICQGHDMISILAIGLRQVLGPAGTKKGVGEEHIAPLLRQAIEHSEFCATVLAQKVIQWEKNNVPYQIFSCGKINQEDAGASPK